MVSPGVPSVSNRRKQALFRLGSIAALLATAGAAVAWAADVASDKASAARPTLPQVASFTAEQVEQGRAVYAANCASCHGPNLNNGQVRPLKGRAFMAHWQAPSMGQLYSYIRQNMPPGRAGALSSEEYASVISFILSENGMKAGPKPLPASAEALKNMRLPFKGPIDASGGLAFHVDLPPPPPRANPAEAMTPVTDKMLVQPSPGDWLTWRRTPDGLGFSPLKEINKANVGELRLVWSYNLPAGPNAATPLVHDGVIFANSFGDNVDALDAKTGEPLWSYRRELPALTDKKVKRNMALYGDKLYFATSDNKLVALEAKTGKLVWEAPMGGPATGGPLVVNGKVIQGLGRGSPVFAPASPGGPICVACHGVGRLIALDAADGHPLWKLSVVPGAGEPGDDSWNGLPPDKRSGGAIWTTSYYDPELNLIFTGTANSYDTAALVKPPPKKPGVSNAALFTDSTLAVNPDTGKMSWYFQHQPNDQWDLDWAFEQQIVWLTIDGKLTKAVLTTGKSGVVDVMEAATGRYLFSLDSGLQNYIQRIDPKTGAKTIDPKSVPGAGKTVTVCPTWGGAKSWTPAAINPDSKVLYLPLTEACMVMEPSDPGEVSAISSGVRVGIRPRPDSDGKYGRLQAMDLQGRKTLWTARQRMPLTSGVLATAGGLVFAGDLDRKLKAYDDATGKVLWETRLGDVPNSAPITFAVDGKQYLAVVVGFGSMFSTSFLPLVPEVALPSTPNSAIYVFAVPSGAAPTP
jgi:alcohol dehydrogenase (cytochrome c)